MKRTICAILTLALLLCLCPAVSFASGEALTLTWSQGTYYDGMINPNLVSRKYAVIDVSEGDVVTFDYPSANWAIYVYYEKAQGTYGYVTSRQGSNESFVVEAIDGWVPTQLQLTAFHRSGSNVTITDALWATFQNRPAVHREDLHLRHPECGSLERRCDPGRGRGQGGSPGSGLAGGNGGA